MIHLRHGSGDRPTTARACYVHESGDVELYFYDELDARERARVADHIRCCRQCAASLDDLRMIRQALAARPEVAAPPGGDWSGFMARLETAIRETAVTAPETVGAAGAGVSLFQARSASKSSVAGLFAMAALLALVTIGVLFVARQRSAMPAWEDRVVSARPDVTPLAASGLRSAGARHFERSKLVVLGLAGRESQEAHPADWAYERELATSLLNDTRLYRIAAEERGLTALAGIMRDLELVLLETSMAEETDAAALEQIQRLIRKRGLIQKMDTVASAGM